VQQIDRAKAAEALEQFHILIDRIVRETDITREELAEAFMAERDEDAPDD
jgi:hypothetical protein